MLEKMGAFFDARLDIYDEHQLTCIDSAREFLDFTAKQLPKEPHCQILDLGCGTGLELEPYFALNPTAQITGIDLAPKMLARLKVKVPDKALHLIEGSYFDVPLGTEKYDGAVSVESLHHFTAAEKLPLYCKLWESLKPDACFILTDYFAQDEAEEKALRAEYERLKTEQGIAGGEFYHFDTPLTPQNEMATLTAAGFHNVQILNRWGATCTVAAEK